MTERMVRANGVDLCIEEFGRREDPAVLLVIGSTASMLRWEDDFCAQLADAGRYVVRYDHRDTGRSTTYTPGHAPYTCEDLAADADALLEELGVEQADVVGASMGGVVGQLLALRNPSRVRSLTLIMSTPAPGDAQAMVGGEIGEERSPLPPPTPEVLEKLAVTLTLDWADEAQVVDQQVELFRALAGSRHPFDEATIRAISVREYRRALEFACSLNHPIAISSTPPWRDRLGQISCPTVVLHGTEDPVLPFVHGEALAKDIPGAVLVALEGTGHEMPRGDWDVLAQAVLGQRA